MMIFIQLNIHNPDEAIDAVEILLVHNTIALRWLKYPSDIQLIRIDTTAARKPITIDWSWIRIILPVIRVLSSLFLSIVPIFAYDKNILLQKVNEDGTTFNHTCVDKRDANVISKFPFKPSKAGTSTYISVIFLNTWNS